MEIDDRWVVIFYGFSVVCFRICFETPLLLPLLMLCTRTDLVATVGRHFYGIFGINHRQSKADVLHALL